MARVEVIDQTIRDGQQALWGMRIRAGHVLPIADAIDAAGYRAVDFVGSSHFEVQVRHNREDPWAGLDSVHAALPRTPLRAGTRTNGVVGMGITPDAIIELWIKTLSRHGIRSLWIFDCLHNTAKMTAVAGVAKEAGIAPSPQVNFAHSPVHTDDYYGDVLADLAASEAVDTIVLGDEAGVLGPERARSWIRLMCERAVGKPLELHFHDRTGMGALNYIIGVEEGVGIVHTAVSALANGPSMPATEVTVDNLRRLGHEVVIDDSRLGEVAGHLGAIGKELGYQAGAPVEYSVAAIEQQFPGGMMGTLRAQLATYEMEDQLPAVLEEAIRVREEMGWPVMATPFSQLVGIQALLNVVQGDRYLTIPDENLMYLAGHYGPPPGQIDEDLKDRAFSDQRGKEMLAWTPPQPSLKEIRANLGKRLSDEELLLRYLIPETDVDAMYAAARPIVPVYPISGDRELGWIGEVISQSTPHGVSITRDGTRIDLRR